MELRRANNERELDIEKKELRRGGGKGIRYTYSAVRRTKNVTIKGASFAYRGAVSSRNYLRNRKNRLQLRDLSKEQLKQWNSYSTTKQRRLLKDAEQAAQKSFRAGEKGKDSAGFLAQQLEHLEASERWEAHVPKGDTARQMKRNIKKGNMETVTFYTDNARKGSRKKKKLENKLKRTIKKEKKEKAGVFHATLTQMINDDQKRGKWLEHAIRDEQISQMEYESDYFKNSVKQATTFPRAKITAFLSRQGRKLAAFLGKQLFMAGKSLLMVIAPMLPAILAMALLVFSISTLGGSPESGSGAVSNTTGLYTSASGEEIVAYARQFIGNPYVWGGTSLTNGADCSGFVQAVFAHFGISLPRTASEQSSAGIEVASLEDMVPGDIITYHSSSSPSGWHVGIYDGEGKIVEAKGSQYGITNDRPANHGTIYSIRRLVSDVVVSGGGGNVTGEKGEFLGYFKLTGYCNCTICCGKWAGGATASGVMPTPHRTVAISKATANRLGLKFGDKLLISGVGYVYEDGGDSNMAGNNWIDIYVGSHSECYAAYCNQSAAEVYRLH